jgi:beta-lactamase regulating signal transducer with metallopeptidase domain
MIELSLLLKATVLLVLGLAVAGLARRARAAVRHLWLAATLGSLALLPIAALAAPAVTILLPERYASVVPPPEPGLAVVTLESRPFVVTGDAGLPGGPGLASGVPSWPDALRIAWLAGAVFALTALALSLARVRRIRRDGLPRPELFDQVQALAAEAGVHRPIDVLEHERVPAPLTCGFWSATIVLPRDARDWSDADVRRALVHEIEHISRGDWAVQVAARAICAVYWFHPLVWMAWRALRLEAERACDDAVLRSADRADYADQLVLLARRFATAPGAMLGMANRSDLSTRVRALLDERQRRGHASAFTSAGALVAAALVVAMIAPVRAVASRQEPQQEQEPRRGLSLTGPNWSWERGQRRETGRGSVIDRALLEAAAEGDADSIDKLLQAGANVNAKLEGDGSPLIAASRTNRLAVVKLLLDRGADPNLAVPGDGAPLLAASREGAVSVMTLLLDRGANVELVAPGDENALIQASTTGHLDAVKLLVARGANVNAQVWAEASAPSAKGEWRTPLSAARRGRHAEVVAFLLASGARD